ncbi:MAG: hypothetical protein ACKKMS_02465 [Candidatus Nealsonbacteria bacterium]
MKKMKKPKLIIQTIKSSQREWVDFIDKILNWKPNKENDRKKRK